MTADQVRLDDLPSPAMAKRGGAAAALGRRRWAAQVAVCLPELGWNVSEACIMPLLLRLRIPPELLTCCWLVSPALTLVLHPLLGKMSDRHGRAPFMFILGLVSASGLALLPVLVDALRGTAAIVAVVAAFGVVDTCNDLLLTPTRAAMNDLFSPAESARRAAVGAGCGKIVALLCVVALGPDGAFEATGAAMLAAAVLQLCTLRDEARQGLYDEPLLAAEAEVEDGSPGASLPPGFWPIWVLNCAGWLAACLLGIATTSAWAQRTGAPPNSWQFEQAVRMASAMLMVASVVFTLAGGAVPAIIRCCGGHYEALVVALLVMSAGLMSFAPAVPQWLNGFCIVFLIPPCYQIVTNAPFSWMESQDSFTSSQRGRLTGMFNSSLSVAQAITSICTGPLVAAFQGRIFSAFAAASVLSGVVALSALSRLRLSSAHSERDT